MNIRLLAIRMLCATLVGTTFISCKNSVVSEEMTKYDLSAIDGGGQWAVLSDDEGRVFEEGAFLNGKKTGTWTTFNPEQNYATTVTNYVNGKKHGLHLEFSNRLQITQRAHYFYDELHGYFAQYKNGRIRLEAEYQNGQYHGMVTKYHDRGKKKVLSQTEYKNGVQDGIYRYFDDRGNMTLNYTYENGKKVSGGIVPANEEEE